MASPPLMLLNRLMAGAYSGGGGAPPTPDPVFSIGSSFSGVDLDGVNVVIQSFTIVRSRRTDIAHTVAWAVAAIDGGLNGTYFQGGALPSGTVTFPAGSAAPVTVSVTFAAVAAPASALVGTVSLSNPSAGTVDTASSSFTFQVNKAVVTPPTPSVAILSTFASVTPTPAAPTIASFVVRRSGPTAGAISVAWATTGADTNPVTSADFVGGVLPSGTVSWADGDGTDKVVTVRVAAETPHASNLFGVVTISGPVGCTLGAVTSFNWTLVGVAPVAVVSIASSFSSVDVVDTGTTAKTFTVSRTGSTVGAISVAWAVTASAGGVGGSDFVGGALPSGTITWADADGATKTVTITFASEAPPVSDEVGVVTLSAPSNCQIGSVSTFSFTINHVTVVIDGPWDVSSYTTNWTLQKGDAVHDSISQETDAVVPLCGTDATSTTASELFWNKTKPGDDWKIELYYTYLDAIATTTAQGIYSQLVVSFKPTDGSNPNDWTSGTYGTCTDAMLAAAGTGYRLSFNTINSLSPGNSNEVRLRYYDGAGNATAIDPVGANAFTFVASREYRLTFEKNGDSIIVSKDAAGGTPAETATFTDSHILSMQGGWAGFRFGPARQCRVRAVNALDLGGGGGGGGGGGPRRDSAANGWATVPTRAVNGDADYVHLTAVSQLSTLAKGKQYVLTADLTGTSVTINDSGTQTEPIVIRGDTSVVANLRKMQITTLTINGSAHVYFEDIDFGSTKVLLNGGAAKPWNHISFHNCLSYGQTTGTGGGFLIPDPLTPGRYLRCYAHTHGKSGTTTTCSLFRISTDGKFTQSLIPKFLYVYNFLVQYISTPSDGTRPSSLTFLGNNEVDYYRDFQASFYDGAIYNCTNWRGVEIKSASVYVDSVTVDRGPTGWGNALVVRHSPNSQISNCLFVQKTGVTPPSNPAKNGGIDLRDQGHLVINNWSAVLDDADTGAAAIAASSTNPFDDLTLRGGNLDFQLYPTNESDGDKGALDPNSARCQVGGNRMAVSIGNDQSYTPNLGGYANICPTTGVSRNTSLNQKNDKDYAGRGKYKLAGTKTDAQAYSDYDADKTSSGVYSGPPAYGTAVGAGSTVTNQQIAGADITKAPKRWTTSNCGAGH
jgi:hypothetical protein